MPIIQNKENIYSDINLDFIGNPNTGDIGILYNVNAVKKSIKHCLFFNKFDIPFDDINYSNIKYLLFEPISNISASILSRRIINVITRLDKRVIIEDVIVKPNEIDDGYDVTILFSLNYTIGKQILQLFLQRNR